jgi:hypothetical protein
MFAHEDDGRAFPKEFVLVSKGCRCLGGCPLSRSRVPRPPGRTECPRVFASNRSPAHRTPIRQTMWATWASVARRIGPYVRPGGRWTRLPERGGMRKGPFIMPAHPGRGLARTGPRSWVGRLRRIRPGRFRAPRTVVRATELLFVKQCGPYVRPGGRWTRLPERGGMRKGLNESPQPVARNALGLRPTRFRSSFGKGFSVWILA